MSSASAFGLPRSTVEGYKPYVARPASRLQWAAVRPARIYDLRSTFASNALALGVTVYELARIMGTSVG